MLGYKYRELERVMALSLSTNRKPGKLYMTSCIGLVMHCTGVHDGVYRYRL
jgi:hypothetical protein